jgi:hypothetical protein
MLLVRTVVPHPSRPDGLGRTRQGSRRGLLPRRSHSREFTSVSRGPFLLVSPRGMCGLTPVRCGRRKPSPPACTIARGDARPRWAGRAESGSSARSISRSDSWSRPARCRRDWDRNATTDWWNLFRREHCPAYSSRPREEGAKQIGGAPRVQPRRVQVNASRWMPLGERAANGGRGPAGPRLRLNRSGQHSRESCGLADRRCTR